MPNLDTTSGAAAAIDAAKTVENNIGSSSESGVQATASEQKAEMPATLKEEADPKMDPPSKEFEVPDKE